MKNRSLAFQIWSVICGILLTVSILLTFLFSTTLQNFFTDEIYTNIENEQHVLTEYGFSDSPERGFGGSSGSRSTNRHVQHVLLPEKGTVYQSPQILPDSFIEKVQKLGKRQRVDRKGIRRMSTESTFSLCSKKIQTQDQTFLLLSYALDSYRDDLSHTLFKQLLFILIVVILLSWIPSIWLAKYYQTRSSRLKSTSNDVKQDWDDPVIVDREDEIGKLGHTIEDMRQKLIQKDETERTLLQNISHDLKTPVMVIRGYTQSIKDGIYPKGDLENTIEVIEGEAEKLEKKIKDLLYLTKLDYLLRQERQYGTFDIQEVIKEVVERLRWSKKELNWKIDLEEETMLTGDQEQWSKLLENVLENQIRYAETFIDISVRSTKEHTLITIKNDGPHIEEEMLSSLYEPFNKGKKGEFGIGLSIVKRILTLHHADMTIRNDQTGVCYSISVPRN